MNKINYTIYEIIKEPYHRVDDEYCCWETIVYVNCYGNIYKKCFRAVSKTEIERYIVGYEYSE